MNCLIIYINPEPVRGGFKHLDTGNSDLKQSYSVSSERQRERKGREKRRKLGKREGVKRGGYQTRLIHLLGEDFQDTGYQGLAGDRGPRPLPSAVIPHLILALLRWRRGTKKDVGSLMADPPLWSQLKHRVLSLSPDYPT